MQCKKKISTGTVLAPWYMQKDFGVWRILAYTNYWLKSILLFHSVHHLENSGILTFLNASRVFKLNHIELHAFIKSLRPIAMSNCSLSSNDYIFKVSSNWRLYLRKSYTILRYHFDNDLETEGALSALKIRNNQLLVIWNKWVLYITLSR